MPLKRLRTTLLAALALAAGCGSIHAEIAGEPGGLPPLTVRPSGYEGPGAEARARQEQLVRKLDRSEFVLRHICTHCMGSSPAPIPGAPERPSAASSEPSRSEAPPQP